LGSAEKQRCKKTRSEQPISVKRNLYDNNSGLFSGGGGISTLGGKFFAGKNFGWGARIKAAICGSQNPELRRKS